MLPDDAPDHAPGSFHLRHGRRRQFEPGSSGGDLSDLFQGQRLSTELPHSDLMITPVNSVGEYQINGTLALWRWNQAQCSM
jgi:hypothetical protein